jgi:4-hydroxyphenylpyruvate dioxygenase
MDVLQWSRHHRLFPGQGAFDLPAFLHRVLAAGYGGPLSLEVFNDVFRQADPVRTAIDGRRSLLALTEVTATLATATTAATPADPVAAPAPRLGGHAFVELATDPAEADALAGTLAALRFTRTGRHRSKPVERWEQGAARILLNSGGAGGAAIAALGVESADPSASARRAQRLCAPLLPRHRGPAEADLATVAAPDGTALFFCRTDAPDGTGWTNDFLPTGEARAGAGITAVDHVGLTQPFDHFDEAALFYRSVLGLQPATSGEFAAPFGLVASRAMVDHDQAVRLGLTVSRLRRGEWAPAVADPQYVAFATDDLLASTRAARAAGVPLLAIPDNYHDDLDARVAIPPSDLAAYRDLGVLYSADDESGGAFLQVCTELLGGRLFLAMVQRIDGYDGYGWADAPVRMAAHRRHRLANPGARA